MSGVFVTGRPVGGNNLIGRKKEIGLIMQCLRMGQSVILVAPRRFGKTSVILHILKKLKREHNYTGWIDIFTVPDLRRFSEKIVDVTLENKKIQNFVHRVKTNLSGLLKKVELRQTIEDFDFILRFSDHQTNEYDLFEKALDFPEQFALKKKRTFYFFYDEIGDVSKFNGDKIIKFMRGKFQAHQRTCYVFAGSHESIMNNIFVKRSGAFYKFGRIIELKEIAGEAFEPFINKRFAENGLKIQKKHISRILDLSKGHPYYTQLICQHIFILAKIEEKNIDDRMVKTGIKNSFLSKKLYLDKLWEEISRNSSEVKFLSSIIQNGFRIYNRKININISRTANNLITRGIIRKESKGIYKIIDPFLEVYIRRITS